MGRLSEYWQWSQPFLWDKRWVLTRLLAYWPYQLKMLDVKWAGHLANVGRVWYGWPWSTASTFIGDLRRHWRCPHVVPVVSAWSDPVRPPPTSCVVYHRGQCWGWSCSSCTLLTKDQQSYRSWSDILISVFTHQDFIFCQKHREQAFIYVIFFTHIQLRRCLSSVINVIAVTTLLLTSSLHRC